MKTKRKKFKIHSKAEFDSFIDKIQKDYKTDLSTEFVKTKEPTTYPAIVICLEIETQYKIHLIIEVVTLKDFSSDVHFDE